MALLRSLVLSLLALPTLAAQWTAVPLPASGDGDWQLAGHFLYIAGRDGDLVGLNRVDTRNWQASAVTLPKDTDHFCALDGGQLLLMAQGHLWLAGSEQNLDLGPLPSIWRGLVPRRLDKVAWCQGQRLFVPDFEELRVFGLDGQRLVQLASLPVAATMVLRNGAPSYQRKALYLADVDLDGTEDLLVEEEQGLVLYLGKGLGFNPTPYPYAPALGLTPLSKRQVRLNDGEDLSKLAIRTVEYLGDLDGDGLADLVIATQQFAGVLDQSIDFDLHFGRRTDNGLGFALVADSQIRTQGVAFALRRQDLDGDGRTDFFTPAVKLGVGKVVSALLTGSVSVDLHLERLDAERRLERVGKGVDADMAVSLSSGEFRIPLMAAATLQEGTSTLAVQAGDQALAIYQLDGDKLRKRQTLKLPLPKDGNRWQQGPGWLLLLPGPQDLERRRLVLVADKVPAQTQP